MERWRSRRRGRRGVSPVIATVLLISLTMVLLGALYYFIKVPLPPPAPYVGFTTEWNNTQVMLIGQGDNAPGTKGGQCPVIDAASGYRACFVNGMVTIVSQVQSPAPLISLIKVELVCNGTVQISAPLTSINVSNVFAASGGGTPPTPTVPVCGGHLTPNYKNGNLNCFGTVGAGVPLYDLVYYNQTNPRSPVIQAGDTFTTYLGGYCISTSIDGSVGDDYYGPPAWCNTIPGACAISLYYTGNPSTFIGSWPLSSSTPSSV